MTGKRCYSLPELYDGGGEARVGGVGRRPVGFVLAVGVLDAVLGVPGLIALGPGQLGLKALHTQYKEWVKTLWSNYVGKKWPLHSEISRRGSENPLIAQIESESIKTDSN